MGVPAPTPAPSSPVWPWVVGVLALAGLAVGAAFYFLNQTPKKKPKAGTRAVKPVKAKPPPPPEPEPVQTVAQPVQMLAQPVLQPRVVTMAAPVSMVQPRGFAPTVQAAPWQLNP